MNQSPETRASLILKLQSADDSMVWDQFVDVYQSVIYRTARRQGLGHEDAAEVTQEVLTRVTKSISDWDHDPQKGSFRGWLYRITRNLSIDFLRKANRQPQTGNDTGLFSSLKDPRDSSENFDHQFERQIFRRVAEQIRHQFAKRSWQAFWLTAVEGESINDTAEQLNMTTGAIYIARSRIMARLKQEVQKTLNETMGD